MSSKNRIGKTASQIISPYKTIQIFGRAFDDEADVSGVTPYEADGITSFNLSNLEQYHEVVVASCSVGNIGTNIVIRFKWYRASDNKCLYTSVYTPSAAYEWAWALSWIGYCSWEINANGGYYVKIYAKDVLLETLYFGVSGIPGGGIPPGRGEITYTIPYETGTAEPNDEIIAAMKIKNAGECRGYVCMKIEETLYLNSGTTQQDTITHSHGCFELDPNDTSDEYRVNLKMKGVESGDFTDLTFITVTYDRTAEKITATDKKTIYVYAGDFLTFKAQTPDRNPLPNALVKIKEQDRPNLTALTDTNGYCNIAIVPPFTGTAIASHQRYRDSYPLELMINSYEDDTFFLRVLPMICSQKFIVAAEDETLLSGAKVTMRTEEGGYIDSTTTDANGECTINFTERYFAAKACCTGYECKQYDLFQCDPGSTIFFFLTPEPKEELGTQQIIQKNAEAMAEAVVSRYEGLTLPGFSAPPHRCPICGESFNTTLLFINHMGSHITAYEEQKKQWR